MAPLKSDLTQDLFDAMTNRSDDAVVGWRDGEPILHNAWLARVRAWASLGRRCAGTRIALFLEDSVEFSAALVGAWLSGKTVWLAGDTLPASCAAIETQVDAFWGCFPAPYDSLVPHTADTWDGEVLRPIGCQPVIVVFTSGSTGVPVAIPKMLSQLTDEVGALERQFGSGMGHGAVLSTVSHQHIYGLLFCILWPLTVGRAIHAKRLAFAETLAPALAVARCILVSSPAHLKRLPVHLDWAGAAQMLLTVFSSGGLLEQDASAHVNRLLGCIPIEVYGSSESGGVAWRQPHHDEGWTALPGVGWRVRADGALEVQSPFADPANWLVLADRAVDSGDGRFMLCGRVDRIVKIEEKRVSLDAMEAVLLATGLVRRVRMILTDQGIRHALVGFVELSEHGSAMLSANGKKAMNAHLRASLAADVAAVVLPRRWRYVSAWPMNSQGKTPSSLLLGIPRENE